MSELGKPFLEKKSDKKIKKTENQCQKAACEQKSTSEKWTFGSNKKLGLDWTMNGNEIAPCELKTTSEKANFCSNTIFSLYFKYRAKKFHAAKPVALSLHFLFRRDQNHYSNLTSKIMKLCE